MRSLNDLLAQYGLEERINPTNKELKSLLRYLTKEERKTGEPLIRKFDERGKIRAVLIGKKVLNRVFFRILAMQAGNVHVKDAFRFNEVFVLGGNNKAKPVFLLKAFRLEFTVNSMEKFVTFEKIPAVYLRVLLMDIFNNRHKELEDFFVEDRLKMLFEKNTLGEMEQKNRMEKMVDKEIKETQIYLNRHPKLEDLKKELLEFFFELTQEVMDEEKERERILNV